MSKQLDQLYRVQKREIPHSGRVFAQAFREDPVWEKTFQNTTEKGWAFFFESPGKYCLSYGKLYSPSSKLEGFAGWLPGEYADMTLWREFRSGTISSAIAVGIKTLLTMKTIFAPLEKARRSNMRGRKYIYLFILGVDPRYQGQGYASKLLRAIIEESEAAQLPIYLETATQKNIQMYKRFGFTQVGQIIHPIINLPHTCMMREV